MSDNIGETHVSSNSPFGRHPKAVRFSLTGGGVFECQRSLKLTHPGSK